MRLNRDAGSVAAGGAVSGAGSARAECVAGVWAVRLHTATRRPWEEMGK